MDIFLEYIVSRKKGTKEMLKICGIILGALALIMVVAFLSLVFAPVASIGFILVVAVVYGAYYLCTAQNIEFEYIVTNGDLDIDKIIHRRKRQRIMSVHIRSFELVAPAGSAEHRGEENANFTRVIDASTGTDNGRAYFAVFAKDGQRIKLIFEPTEKMLEAFKTFVPRKVFVKE